jgi:predicted house-cleaning noncanonical NTP pyrophosphatase (MazG superfamily)
MLNEKFLEELEEYLKSGRLEEDFEYSAEDRRYEILDYLERLMDIAELADEVATRLIFKNSQLGQLFNSNAQK